MGLPPEPWPDIPPGYVFGDGWEPPGTIYVFSEDAALQRTGPVGNVWRELWKRLAREFPIVDGSGQWEVPVRYARAQIHATLPGNEEIIHSLAYRPTDDTVNVSGQQLHDFAVALAGELAGWMAASDVGSNFVTGLKYDQINISYIEQNTGTDASGKGGDQHTLIPTIGVPITPVIAGTQVQQPLPYECALVLTLNTDTRGPSTRGRVYLGGLSTQMMTAGGLYNTAVCTDIAQQWGVHMVGNIHDNTSWRANVISRRYARAREIQGVMVGTVPDAQRRRRNAIAEPLAQAWGTPAGAIPPG